MNLKTFYMDQAVEYQEFLCEDELIHKFYLIRNEKHIPYITIPDGCVDIQFLFEENSKKACISGSVEKPHVSHYVRQKMIFGVKLNPGIVPACMDIEGAKLLDSHVPISGQKHISDILEKLESAENAQEMAEIVRDEITGYVCGRTNQVVKNALSQILSREGCVKLEEMAEQMRYSRHYMNLEFKKYMGFSMKQYAKIIRLQSAIAYLENQKTDLVYEKLGYYDQSHFIRDFKKFTLMTPGNYTKKQAKRSFV